MISNYNTLYDIWFYRQFEEYGQLGSELEWTPNHVDLKLVHDHDDAKIGRMIDLFSSLDVPQLREGTVVKLFDAGFQDPASVINAPESALVAAVGEAAGRKVYNGIKQKLNPVSIYDLAGSSQVFGRGIGKRKFKKLFEQYNDILGLTHKQIVDADGFDTKSADKIIGGMGAFKQFLSDIEGKYTLKVEGNVEGPLSGVGVCFTGVRSKELEEAITAKGGRIDSSVTKKTTYLVCKDPSSGSAKLKKAADAGVQIVSIENAWKMWG